jgi:ribose/xylose/arabinose/galactoside ABC-type transport system permease subunit
MTQTESASRGIDWKKWLNAFGPILALFVVWGFFACLNKRILSPIAIEQIVQQTVVVGIAAIGMTLIIISAGIDLSVGSAIALNSVVCAYCITKLHLPPAAVVCVTIVSGCFTGFLIGSLVVFCRLIPFIATLGTLLIYRGEAKRLADAQAIDLSSDWLSFWLTSLPDNRKWMLIPPGGWLMIVLALLAAGGLRYTKIGRHIFALGSNEHTAVLCGVAVKQVKLFVYTLGGFFAAISGLMFSSYQSQGDPNGANGLELDVIAAVVIGGGSLSGGAGSVFGSLVGALIMTVIRVGCSLNGVETSNTQVITGVVILVAVALDRFRQVRK